jgi:hypothetical protein
LTADAYKQHAGCGQNAPPRLALEEIPRGLLANNVSTQSYRSSIERISKWMQICFIESAVQRTILRTAKTTQNFFPYRGADWTVLVLKNWEMNQPPPVMEVRTEQKEADASKSAGAGPTKEDQQSPLKRRLSDAFSFASSRQAWFQSVWKAQIGKSDNELVGVAASTDGP